MEGVERHGNKQSQKAGEEKNHDINGDKDRETIPEMGKETKEGKERTGGKE